MHGCSHLVCVSFAWWAVLPLAKLNTSMQQYSLLPGMSH